MARADARQHGYPVRFLTFLILLAVTTGLVIHLLHYAPSAPMAYKKYNWIEKDGFIPLWLNWHFKLHLGKQFAYLTDPEHDDEQAVKYVLPCVKRDALRN